MKYQSICVEPNSGLQGDAWSIADTFRYVIRSNPPIFVQYCLPHGLWTYSIRFVPEIALKTAVWNFRCQVLRGNNRSPGCRPPRASTCPRGAGHRQSSSNVLHQTFMRATGRVRARTDTPPLHSTAPPSTYSYFCLFISRSAAHYHGSLTDGATGVPHS